MMQRYELATPRLALGTAAVALAATTLAVLVVIPATIDIDAYAQAPMIATSTDAEAASIQGPQLAAAPCALPSEERRHRKDASL